MAGNALELGVMVAILNFYPTNRLTHRTNKTDLEVVTKLWFLTEFHWDDVTISRQKRRKQNMYEMDLPKH